MPEKSIGLPSGGAGQWFEFVPPVEGASERKRKKTSPSPEVVSSLQAKAKAILDGEVAWLDSDKGRKAKSTNNDAGFLRKIMSSGTLSDKMASMLLMVQESPMQRLTVLDMLVKMAQRKGKREHIMALETLKDLFSNNLLPDRKLSFFQDQQCLQHPNTTDTHLVFWYFEDAIKRRFALFVECLEEASHDSLPHVKSKTCRMSYDLIRSKPEREEAMLSLLVNKLGDTDNKLASLVSHLLSKLLQEHPAMKGVVVSEVHRLLFRPNVSERAQHYGVVFLNQVVLSAKDGILARTLVSCYLSLFRQQLAVKRDLDNKTMTALLAGIHRALPFTVKDAGEEGAGAGVAGAGGEAGGEDRDKDRGPLEEHVDSIFKMVYVSTFNTAVQALQVLFSATCISGVSPTSRYYRALYARLGSVELLASSKHTLFLNLLFKSLKADSNKGRVTAFLKRLLHVSAAASVSFAVGALILTSEMVRSFPTLAAMFTKSHGNGDASDDDDDDDDDGDDKDGRDEAHDKVKKVEVGDDVVVFGLVAAPQFNGSQGIVKGSEGERFVVHVEGVDKALRVKAANLRIVPARKEEEEAKAYDGHKRDPEHCGAEGEPAWELSVLRSHFHPTVRLFAEQLCRGDKVEYAGDPLTDFQTINFLDKFVYKKPKKRKDDQAQKGGSLMQRLGDRESTEAPVVNSAEWLKAAVAKESKVGADEEFFVKFFAGRDERRKGKGRMQHKRRAKEDEEAQEDEEAFGGAALSDDDDEDEEGDEDEDEDGEDGGESDDEDGLDMGGGSDYDEEEEEESDEEGGARLNMGGGSDDGRGEDDEEGQGEDDDDDMSSGGYSDMDADLDDEDDDVGGGKVSKVPKSTRDAEQEMMREIEAGLASDDSDIEFNSRRMRGKAFDGEEEKEEEEEEEEEEREEVEPKQGNPKKAKKDVEKAGKKAKGSTVFASADDYEELILKGEADREFEDLGDGKAKGDVFGGRGRRGGRGRGGVGARGGRGAGGSSRGGRGGRGRGK